MEKRQKLKKIRIKLKNVNIWITIENNKIKRRKKYKKIINFKMKMEKKTQIKIVKN